MTNSFFDGGFRLWLPNETVEKANFTFGRQGGKPD